MLQVEKDAEQLHEQEFEIERLQTEVVELRARLDDAIAGSEDSAAALSNALQPMWGSEISGSNTLSIPSATPV